MKPRRFTPDAEPIEHHSRRGDSVRDWLTLLLPFLVITCAMAMVLWFLWQALTMGPIRTDTPSAADSLPRSVTGFSDSPSAATWPAEVLQAARAISTFTAPTPTPSPIPYQTPTPLPVTIWCGLNSRIGQSCQWPAPTMVATAIPTLPVCETPMPMSSCIYMGDISSTPVTVGAAKGT